MATQISKLKIKIRALIEDWLQTDSEVFSYDANATSPNVFQLAEGNATTITKVYKNLTDITDSADIDLNTDTAKVTITLGSGDSWIDGDEIEIIYTFYDYSDTEITEYIRGALIYFSIYANSEQDYELETNSISPTPDNRTLDLIAFISAIEIKPDWNEYVLPNLRVRYNNRIPKDQKIQKLCGLYNHSWGKNDILEFN